MPAPTTRRLRNPLTVHHLVDGVRLMNTTIFPLFKEQQTEKGGVLSPPSCVIPLSFQFGNLLL